MNLIDLIKRKPPIPWMGSGKIPWDEPEFSRRMLESHLSQSHDWASRRYDTIDRHVEFIAAKLPQQAEVLDLGCGPGFYTQRLARLGCQCTGVDFSPASIAYAQEQAAEAKLDIEYILEDIRHYLPNRVFDAVLLTFGEFNVFQESDAALILRNASTFLKPGGFLLLEVQRFEYVKIIGHASTAWQANEKGIFSDSPHLCLQETFWDENTTSASARHYVVDLANLDIRTYEETIKAYGEDELHLMLDEAGFVHATPVEADDWPPGKDFERKLKTYFCSKNES